MNNIVVREMLPTEISDVHKIGRRAFTGVESLWVGKPKQAFVAVKDNTIVGAILYKYIIIGKKKIGYIDYAFVDPAYHDCGVGNTLYKETIEYLMNQECDALTSVVKDDNVGSWRLFLKNGFHRINMVELVRKFGIIGALKQYFGTPLCFGVGMEYYVLAKETITSKSKTGTLKQITTFILINLLIFSSINLIRFPVEKLSIIGVTYISILLSIVFAEYIGTRLSTKRKWTFRFNNGGALISSLISFGTVFPMIGNWYPHTYEKSKDFNKDLGIVSLCSWIVLLAVTSLSIFSGIDNEFIYSIKHIGIQLLLYRMIPFYPFESFGGRRVCQWNKWIYGSMVIISLIIIFL